MLSSAGGHCSTVGPGKQAGVAVAGRGCALPFSENKQGRTEENY